jgi:2-oxoglutarate ferredoxin oxidoreductase subunit beta
MDRVAYDIAWCPGCGNYQIRESLQEALTGLDFKPQDVVIVSGIGQAAKIGHYVNANVFNGLHGRALSPAMAIKVSNPNLAVIVESGDGCSYGEGGNHFVHTILRNPNITMFVHDNMVYGLTKGQASPTSQCGFVTSVQTADRQGVTNEPFNPLSVAVSLGASFVGRAFSGDKEQTKELMMKAIQHKGFALLDILQPCVTYNRVNNFKWYKENTYYVSESYDPTNRVEAFKKSIERDKLPLGIIYLNPNKPTFEENTLAYESEKKPLFQRSIDKKKLSELIERLTSIA